MEEKAPQEKKKTGEKPNLLISDRAGVKIREHLDKSGKNPAEFGFRIAVKAGGCSGLEYEMDLGAKRFGDHIFSKNGVSVFVDGDTMEYVDGSTLEYIETIKQSSFQIINPNATGSCGCGVSFSV